MTWELIVRSPVRFGVVSISLSGFDKDLSAHPVCALTLGSPIPEGIKSATDPAVCRAVLAGNVAGAPIDDIEPLPLTAEALTAGAASKGFPLGVGPFQMVARGHIDVDNDTAGGAVQACVFDAARYEVVGSPTP